MLLVRDAPAHGVVVGRVRTVRTAEEAIAATATIAGKPVDVQLVPPLDPASKEWLVVLKVPGAGDHRVWLGLSSQPAKLHDEGPIRVAGKSATFTHHVAKKGGLPRSIHFPGCKKTFDSFVWNDRVHDPKLGSFLLRHDAGASVDCVSRGAICTAVRVRASYVKPDGSRHDSLPGADYDWIYFHDLPLVFVRAHITQFGLQAWRELHFLELNYPDRSFPAWAGGEPAKAGTFTASKKGFGFDDWAMLRDGRAAVAMLRAGRMLFHDGRGAYGTYLHAHATRAWGGWQDWPRSLSAWLWIGEADDPVAEVRQAADALPSDARVVATRPAFYRKLTTARREARKITDPRKRAKRLFQIALAEKHEAEGRCQDGQELLAGTSSGFSIAAGDLAVAVDHPKGGGGRLLSLYDLATGTELAAASPPPLFTVTMRHVKTGRTVELNADDEWGHMDLGAGGIGGVTINWGQPGLGDLANLKVHVRCLSRGPMDPDFLSEEDAKESRLRWTFIVTNPHKDWGIWRVVFPRVAIGPFAKDMRVLIPQAAGVVKKDIWRKPVRFKGTYPSGWTAMQFLAVYDAAGKTGLYLAAHDPKARAKDILVQTDPSRRQVVLAFDQPVPNMGQPGGKLALYEESEWRLFRGDWFDACMIYRDWVRRKAKWWPKLTDDGRADTPKWMRELCLWGLLGGGAEHAAKTGRRFAEVMQMPVGFHWYSWHQIPFDNDYPHYFPPKKGFKDAVAALQGMTDTPAYVMPYINGRLWDTHDRGAKDFEFTKLARPAATKDVNGKVHTETYGSKEADGSKVTLAAMCPATKLWRDRVKGIVLRLMKDCGTKAVYIDQIAAAKPRLCFDASHGHPLGGGGWWVEAYGKLLTDLRKAMPPGCMLTTECNAEPYVKHFDGYLTWHWQYDGQVPAFPAVYGGAIQMFGRAYRGGPTKDIALRMKAGQQLVFGEQIGWIGVGVANEKANAAFLRQVARLRLRLVRYFHAGQMARPPKLAGRVPTVTADWQWHGVWPVTTDAVLTGAWELPKERKLALIFVNVSDKPVTAPVPFDAAAYGLTSTRVRLTKITSVGRGQTTTWPSKFVRKITFEPGEAWAWEIAPAGS